MQYHGSCHCGKVKFSFAGEFGAALSCNCSICSRKGSLLWFTPRENLQLTGENELATYTFNKHVIKHRFCKTCGVQPLGEAVDPKGVPTAAINIRCLEDFDLSKVPLQPWDGRSR
ncbi:MAG TPA: GFA family protein [Steroidobacteraceae bacterium]|nr:GFA family protein [Steroidobacteraceae bacterium]